MVNPSHPPSRFPSTLEISLGLRPREISRVLANLLGVRDGFPNTSLVLVEQGYDLMKTDFNIFTLYSWSLSPDSRFQIPVLVCTHISC